MAGENKLGVDLFQCDNILEPITFQELIDTIRCNNGNKKIDQYIVMKELQNIFVSNYDDMIYLVKNNIKEIITAINGNEYEDTKAKVKPTVGYEVCYDYKGYQLNAGNRIVFPSREIAEKYKRNYQQHDWVDEELYISETESVSGELTPCRLYNGKEVYNKDWYFGIDALEVGDYVEEEIVDYLMNCLPPVCYRSDCCQIGEPFNYRIDKNGVVQPTFGTFKKVAESTWEFCGYCFDGENEMCGENIQYIPRANERS